MSKKFRVAKRATASAMIAVATLAPSVTWGATSSPTSSPTTTSTVTTTTTQVMAGSVSPLVASGKASLVSALPAAKKLTLAFVLKPRQMTTLTSLVATGAKVAPALYQSDFAPTPQMQQSVQSFATQNGFTVLSSSPDVLLVQASAAQIENAFHVTLNNYQSNQKQFYSTANDPTLPTNVAANLVSIVGLNQVTYSAAPVTLGAGNAPGTIPVTPDAIRSAYGFIPAYGNNITGAGEKIAILMTGGYQASDVQSFSQTFGLPYDATKINAVAVAGTPAPTDGAEMESTLDVEWSHAIAPGASITEFETGDLSNSSLVAGMDAAIQWNPTVLNMSFGAPENFTSDSDLAAWHALFLQMVAKGITPVAASGDYGAYFNNFADQSVEQPASDPLVLAVGGTSVGLDATNTRTSETAWDESNGTTSWIPGTTAGSGGGYSTVFSDPVSLTGTANPNVMRAVPDVSLVAQNLVMTDNGAITYAGGTSFAAPMWSGLIALAAQQAGHSFGQIRPAIYSLAQGSNAANLFHDITSGSNGAYSTGIGYDPVTGWGSPQNAWDLIQALATSAANTGPTGTNPVIDGIVVTQYASNTNQTIFNGSGTVDILGSGFVSPQGTSTVTLTDAHGSSYPLLVKSWSANSILVDTDALFAAAQHPTAAGQYTLTVSTGSGNVSYPVTVGEFVAAADSGPTTDQASQTVTLTIRQPDGTADTSYTGAGAFYAYAPVSTAAMLVSQGGTILTPDPITNAYPIQFTNGQAQVQVTSDTPGTYTYQAVTTPVTSPVSVSLPDFTAQFTAGASHTLQVVVASPYETVGHTMTIPVQVMDASWNVANSSDTVQLALSVSGGSGSGNAQLLDSKGNPLKTSSITLVNGQAAIQLTDNTAETLTLNATDQTNASLTGTTTIQFVPANSIVISAPTSPTPMSATPTVKGDTSLLNWQGLTLQSVAADGKTVTPFAGGATFVIQSPSIQQVYVQQQLNGTWTDVANTAGTFFIDLSSGTNGTANIRVATVMSGAQTPSAPVNYAAYLNTADLPSATTTGQFTGGAESLIFSMASLVNMATSATSNPQYDAVNLYPMDANGNISPTADQVTVTESAGGPAVQLAVPGTQGLQTLSPTNGQWSVQINPTNPNAFYVTSQETGTATFHLTDVTNSTITIPDVAVSFVNSVPTSLRAVPAGQTSAGVAEPVTVDVVDQNGQPVVNNSDQIAMTISHASGTLTVTDSKGTAITPNAHGQYVLPAVAGVASYEVTDSAAETPVYTFTDLTEANVRQVSSYKFIANPIAPVGTLSASATQTVSVEALDPNGLPVPNAAVFLAFTKATGGGSAVVGSTSLTSGFQQFATDASGQVTIQYTTPATLPVGVSDTISVQDTPLHPGVTGTDSYTFPVPPAPTPTPTPTPTPPGGGSNGGSGGGGTSGTSGTGTTGGSGNSGSGGTGTSGGTSGGSTGTPTSSLPTTVSTQSFGQNGGTVQKTVGSSKVTLSVPSGAFSTPETVSITTGPVSQLSKNPVPSGTSPVVAFGVSFSGAAPNVPITLTITDPSIPAGAVVYKIGPNGTLIPVQATVVAGKAVISFSSDPDFVVVKPASSVTKPVLLNEGQRAIVFNGKTTIVPGFVHSGTTYMPIWYVMQLLNSIGVQSQWNGQKWSMTTTLPIDLTNLHPGTGPAYITINGRIVQYVPSMQAVDPASHQPTTFVPIYYVMQILNRLHIQSLWDGQSWTLTKK